MPTPRIALLATGDEITCGDILNTNGRTIAARLFEHTMSIGWHITTSDDQHDIQTAITQLLSNHDVVIITGGLGPTSDDRTRFALSAAINRPLIADENTWQAIVERMKRIRNQPPIEENRQQTLFPDGATILPNPHGTAPGCAINVNQQWLFMLPGPPNECLPMFETYVLPQLIKLGMSQTQYRKKWLLFGVSEGDIAAELDACVKGLRVTTGFRLSYPYLECKLQTNDKEAFTRAEELVTQLVQPHRLGNNIEPISHTLRHLLETTTTTIEIVDHATHGYLDVCLRRPAFSSRLQVNPLTPVNPAIPRFTITGFTDYWCANNKASTTTLTILSEHQGEKKTLEFTVPCYHEKTIYHAVERCCAVMHDCLQKKRG